MSDQNVLNPEAGVNSLLPDDAFEAQLEWARSHPSSLASELKKPQDLLREVARNWTRTQQPDYRGLLNHLREINTEMDDALRADEVKLICDDAWNRYLRGMKAELFSAKGNGQHLDKVAKVSSPDDPTHTSTHTCEWMNGQDIQPKNVDFLWNNRFVANRINIVAGMGDVGKDVFCCTVAACVTTGRDWPDGSKGCEPGIVGVISPEDDPDDTIVPRLMAAGCNMSKVRIWTANRRPTPEEIADLKVLIVSPLINLMDKKQEMNCEKDARYFLELWQGSLKDVGCTVIGTAHLNKKTDAPIVQRILGASGIANFVRSNWTIQRDDEDKTLRLFLRLKANLVPDLVDGLQFRIQHVGPWQQSIVCAWCGTTEKTPDGVMNGNKVAKSAVKWLLDFLKGKGDVRRDEIMAAAAEAGYTERAVRQAKERHPEVVDFQIGYPARAWWRLDV